MTYNSAYTGPQIDKAARLASIIFDDLPVMLADARDYTAHTAGDVFWTAAEGFRYRVAASGATDHHLTTAGGVKVYVLPNSEGTYNFKAFNPAADGTTDDYAVLRKALDAVLFDNGVGPDIYITGPKLYLPDARYKINTTVIIKAPTHIFGSSAGHFEDHRAELVFPADTMGIMINAFESGADTEIYTSGAASRIEGIKLTGGGGTDATAHGIWLRARAVLRNVSIMNFAGNGLHIVASVPGEAPGQPEIWGNANLWRAEAMRMQGNIGWGMFVQGSDVNAGTGISLDLFANFRGGLRDNSFLGNTYISCHTSTNGWSGASGGSVVKYDAGSGLRKYAAVYPATEAQLVATTPGSNEAIWSDRGAVTAESPFATWLPDQPEGTYFLSAGYWLSNDNARTLLLGSYSESDEAGNIYDGALITVIGGCQTERNFGRQLYATDGNRLVAGGSTFSDGTRDIVLAGDANSQELLRIGSWRLRGDSNGTDLLFDHSNADARQVFWLTGDSTTRQMGTGAGVPYCFATKQIAIGNGTNDGNALRRQQTGTAAPTTGAWARGDIVWNRSASAGGWAGWVCVTAGTPGTWKRFGAIEV